jgi:flagellin-like hook-associated protein FlgL
MSSKPALDLIRTELTLSDWAALTANDQLGVQRAAGLLDSAADNVTFAHGAIGARSQTLNTLSAHLDDEHVQLKKSLSDEVDVDFVQTVSDLTARQAAYQASRQLSAQLQQQTLLNYL